MLAYEDDASPLQTGLLHEHGQLTRHVLRLTRLVKMVASGQFSRLPELTAAAAEAERFADGVSGGYKPPLTLPEQL